jgi:hypothetical protein
MTCSISSRLSLDELRTRTHGAGRAVARMFLALHPVYPFSFDVPQHASQKANSGDFRYDDFAVAAFESIMQNAKPRMQNAK